MVAVMSYAISESLDPTTQLYGKSSGSFGLPIGAQKGKSLGPAPTVSMIKGLENMAQMAIYLGYDPLASLYQSQAQLSRNAIESLLWNSTDGYYAATLGSTDIEIMDIAQILIAGIGSYEQRDQYLEKLRSLKVPAGYLNGTAYFDTPGIVNPYHMSFLLEGLAKEGHTVLAQELLDNTYSPMVRRDVNYTGGYWEYVVSQFRAKRKTKALNLYAAERRWNVPRSGSFHGVEPLLGFLCHSVSHRVRAWYPCQHAGVYRVCVCPAHWLSDGMDARPHTDSTWPYRRGLGL